jgi:signal transduction histidine kinase
LVADNGIGMTNEIRNNIFQHKIVQSQRGTNQEKGTGLGLLICKEFVEILGGKIWVESIEGKGSTFYFSIPC